MELYYVLTILDRDKRHKMEKLYKSLGLRIAITMMGKGTATEEHLSIGGLSPTKKAVLATIVSREDAKTLFLNTKKKLDIDIPGNGIMAAVPIKSVGGAQTLAYMTENQQQNQDKPNLKFEYELIYVIVNEGHSNEVMDAARPAGATGGTVIAAKGTGIAQSEQFSGMSLADEKEVVLIAARSSNKADIMRAIIEKAGLETPAGAICFSMPVTQIAGIRRLDEE